MMQPQQEQQQQHPVHYVSVGRRSNFLLGLKDILTLRVTAKWLRNPFRAAQLRQWLTHSLSQQAGLRRVVNGQPLSLLVFDDQHMDEAALLTAVCVTEAGGSDEMGKVIELAAKCGYCHLPVSLTAADILDRYANKTAFLSEPRVLAHLKLVGRHINFGDAKVMLPSSMTFEPRPQVCFQLFEQGDRLRAILDHDDFDMIVDPPIPANHPFHQHRQAHDPPVRCSVEYSTSPMGGYWKAMCAPQDGSLYASASSFVKYFILDHFRQNRQPTQHLAGRHVGHERILALLMQSSHTRVDGCTTSTTSWLRQGSDFVPLRCLVLTDASHPFVAWVHISVPMTRPTTFVSVRAYTTECAVPGGGDAFKVRFPITTRLARVVLGAAVAAMMFDR
ncbi:unnamed protein product [Vitrella brassicaformis CCMP3155]|uniref:Uncharacterized protein n=1 Tax=Vitrella brassicaformis (strain CCMP3155) TaxID=1169540 RepID=A0A0G4EPQ3_VITBC|nr:unnamed protein product [Vitrella brassicaformis CCMP3155]|eukprot:CEL99808.1 unnamed protein product [Vitrella brassicaformis CCMP3155]